MDLESPKGSVEPATSENAVSFPRTPPPVADHELLRCIGRGSYGDVWLARNVLGDLRAIKFVYRDRFTDLRPFQREFEGIQRFEPISRSHPSQLNILHVGKNESAGCFYYVMELADDLNAEGGVENRESHPVPNSSLCNPHSYAPCTLRAVLQARGRLPVSECIEIGLSLATALQQLHEQGLVHRDIKPSNVIFVSGMAKLGDIGLVTDAGDTQSIVGTEGYLPPDGPGTQAADLYALGKVLYEAFTGMDRRKLPELPKDLLSWKDAAQALELNEIVVRACAREVDHRYADVGQMRGDFELVHDGNSVKQARRWALRRRMAAMLTIGSLIVGVATAISLNFFRQGAAAKSPDGSPSTNELANAKCSRALMLLRSDTYLAYGEVYTNLHQAAELDPTFARPYVGFYELRCREAGAFKYFQTNESLEWIAANLQKLGPNLSASWIMQSWFKYNNLDYPEADELARKAIQAAPDHEIAHNHYAWMLINWGRIEDAQREMAAARRILPNKAANYRFLGHAFYAQRDFKSAIAKYHEALEWNKNEGPSLYYMGCAYRALGDYSKAIDYFEAASIASGGSLAEAKRENNAYRNALAIRGTNGYWEERIMQLDQLTQPAFYLKAQALIHLGASEKALGLLVQSFETRERVTGRTESWMHPLLYDESWDGIRVHPRFQDLLDKVGFTKVNPKLKK